MNTNQSSMSYNYMKEKMYARHEQEHSLYDENHGKESKGSVDDNDCSLLGEMSHCM